MKTKKVVFVDDNPNDLILYGAMTKTMKYDVMMINDPSIAVNEILKFKPNIVFLDVKLNSSISGLDILDELKSNNLKAKIVMLSGLNDEDIIFKTIKHGADNYLLKPIFSNSLNNLIESSNGNIKRNRKQMFNYS